MVIIVLLLIAGVAAGAKFLFPYAPKLPPKADESNATADGIQKVVNANNKFAFDLYNELDKSEKGNVFYSPYSVSAALAMVDEGAVGQTADEINAVFHFPSREVLRPNFASIYNGINNGSGAYELRTGNALWVQQDYPFLDSYKTNVEKYYGGKAAPLDFVKDTENSRKTINSFIEEQTNGKIKELIPSGVLNPMSRAVLTNAIYFKGTWEWEFDKSRTYDDDFKLAGGNSIKVQMMHMSPEKARFNYAYLDNLQILELPYKDGKISMLILLPKESLDSLAANFTAEKLNDYKAAMNEQSLDNIYIPKFEFDTKYFMKDTLSALGMPTAFSINNADFSGIAQAEQLYISQVIHQAYVKVDEKGTEAAAATAVGMEAMASAPSEKKIFRADHPFVFVIQNKETGNILFMGRFSEPAK